MPSEFDLLQLHFKQFRRNEKFQKLHLKQLQLVAIFLPAGYLLKQHLKQEILALKLTEKQREHFHSPRLKLQWTFGL